MTRELAAREARDGTAIKFSFTIAAAVGRCAPRRATR